MRRRAGLKPSTGTVWPAAVRVHVQSHYARCIGPLAGMPGDCDGGIELDHIRASHGIGMKSEGIATNGAQLCNWHHDLKTRNGKTWRPRLLDVVASLIRDCEPCLTEWREHYGPLGSVHEAHVDPCGPDCRAAVPA